MISYHCLFSAITLLISLTPLTALDMDSLPTNYNHTASQAQTVISIEVLGAFSERDFVKSLQNGGLVPSQGLSEKEAWYEAVCRRLNDILDYSPLQDLRKEAADQLVRLRTEQHILQYDASSLRKLIEAYKDRKNILEELGLTQDAGEDLKRVRVLWNAYKKAYNPARAVIHRYDASSL